MPQKFKVLSKGNQPLAQPQSETGSGSIPASGSGASIPMPKEFKFYNATSERCDMAQGPCACGAWHRLSDWPPNVIAAITPAVAIPVSSLPSARLIVKEAASVLEGCARHIEKAGDWRSVTAANLAKDHARKLKWILELLNAEPLNSELSRRQVGSK